VLSSFLTLTPKPSPCNCLVNNLKDSGIDGVGNGLPLTIAE
jgi:hypothetical protein